MSDFFILWPETVYRVECPKCAHIETLEGVMVDEEDTFQCEICGYVATGKDHD